MPTNPELEFIILESMEHEYRPLSMPADGMPYMHPDYEDTAMDLIGRGLLKGNKRELRDLAGNIIRYEIDLTGITDAGREYLRRLRAEKS